MGKALIFGYNLFDKIEIWEDVDQRKVVSLYITNYYAGHNYCFKAEDKIEHINTNDFINLEAANLFNHCIVNNTEESQRAITSWHKLKDEEKILYSDVVKSQIDFLANVITSFRTWFNLNCPEMWNGTEINKNKSTTLLESSQKADTEVISSLIDQEKELIQKATNFINAELRKLGDKVKPSKIAEIAASAYAQIIPIENKNKLINVSKFAESIYPNMNHDIKDWNVEKFLSILYTKTPRKSPSKRK